MLNATLSAVAGMRNDTRAGTMRTGNIGVPMMTLKRSNGAKNNDRKDCKRSGRSVVVREPENERSVSNASGRRNVMTRQWTKNLLLTRSLSRSPLRRLLSKWWKNPKRRIVHEPVRQEPR
jgi:hypothetical protein